MGTTVRAEAVEYRRGFVEISNVHPGSVNLEAWRVRPGAVLELNAYGRPALPEGTLLANIEIEFSPEAAEELITALRSAIDAARIVALGSPHEGRSKGREARAAHSEYAERGYGCTSAC